MYRFPPAFKIFSPQAWQHEQAEQAKKINQPIRQSLIDPLFTLSNSLPSNPLFSADQIQLIYWPLVQWLVFRWNIRSTCALDSPYILGITGSVSVGKSSLAVFVQTLLQSALPNLKIGLINTDGFIKPYTELAAANLLPRKGFPESYDNTLLTKVLQQLRAGKTVEIPLYSHEIYDRIPDRVQTLAAPDIVIVEGLNVIRPWVTQEIVKWQDCAEFDDIIFVDAELAHIKHWFLARFERLRAQAKQDPQSYYVRFLTMSDQEALEFANNIWNTINARNYAENLAPYRQQANLILQKTTDHTVAAVAIRE